jgi:hypothetical protein
MMKNVDYPRKMIVEMNLKVENYHSNQVWMLMDDQM